MADNPSAFKHMFDEAVVRSMATDLSNAGPFEADAFIGDCMAELEQLELKDRVRLIARSLHRHLPDDYPSAIGHILAVLPPPKTNTEDLTDGFRFWPYCQFVEDFGLEHLDESLDAMLELTQRFSAEFAVRPYILKYPDEVLSQFAEWTQHPNAHVRRWVSEGTRPRLPWGMRLGPFIDDPATVLDLLESLRTDPEEYVRRSVANNLNDIAKDHPQVVVETAVRWSEDANQDEQRMIKHALRTLVKKGDRGALAVIGFGPVELEVTRFAATPATIPIGEKVELELGLQSLADESQSLLIDYVVHHQRANGSTSPKVFKWSTRKLDGNEKLELTKKHSMKVVTTRTYYPGTHRVELQVNGEVVAETSFELEV